MHDVPMTDEARVLMRELLRQHESTCLPLNLKTAGDVTDGMIERCVLPYGILCERAGLPFLTHSVGTFLGEIAEFCDENDWPPLNALAVNGTERMPGGGYDVARGCALINWPEQVKRCIAFKHYPSSRQI